MAGKQFMYGLELAGPFMALLIGAVYALIGWGLFRLQKWARWAAMAVMASASDGSCRRSRWQNLVFRCSVRIPDRSARCVAWYLSQAPSVVDSFAAKILATDLRGFTRIKSSLLAP